MKTNKQVVEKITIVIETFNNTA